MTISFQKLVTDLAVTACSFTPKNFRPKCEDFVETLIGENFEILRQFTIIFGPEDVCEMIMMCPKGEGNNQVLLCLPFLHVGYFVLPAQAPQYHTSCG